VVYVKKLSNLQIDANTQLGQVHNARITLAGIELIRIRKYKSHRLLGRADASHSGLSHNEELTQAGKGNA
jgi:hypothetical protein